MDLNIGKDFQLPADAATQTLVVYGGKGMGKTNLAAVLCEEMAHAHVRFSLLDPVGVSWGLRHSADGKGPGIDPLILGGRRGDIPIEPTAGAIVADLVADESVNTIVDISSKKSGELWGAGEKIRFAADYATRLFSRQGERREPLMQLIDEAGRFVPQQIPHGAVDIARCVGAIEQLVELGRNVGVGVTLITQRSARMNKSVSELAECMIAFRTVGPRSIAAILDWFGEHIPKERWNDLVKNIRALPIGRALVVSPGWLEFEGEVQVRMRRTFDSSATPKPGQHQKHVGKPAQPDLIKYQERMAATIEKAKENDPRELWKKIADLEQKLRSGSVKENKENPADARALKEWQDRAALEARRHLSHVEEIEKRLVNFRNKMVSLSDDLLTLAAGGNGKQTAPLVARSSPSNESPKQAVPRDPPRHAVVREPAMPGEIDGGRWRILRAIATLNRRRMRVDIFSVSRWLGVHPNGGRFRGALKSLRDNGYLQDFSFTDKTHALNVESLCAPGAEGILSLLPEDTHRRIFTSILEQPAADVQELGARLGLHPNGGRYRSALRWLRQMAVIPESGTIQAQEGVYGG